MMVLIYGCIAYHKKKKQLKELERKIQGLEDSKYEDDLSRGPAGSVAALDFR